MDFYYSPASATSRSVLMTAKAIGIELNKIVLHLSAGDHLKPAFVKLNPQHTIPTLVDNGFVVWESRAILIYLVEQYAKTDSLYPKCPEKQALINQRLYFDMGTLYRAFAEYYYPQIKNKLPADPEKFKQIESAFGYLDTFLEGQTYLVGDSLTIADIAIVASISQYAIADFDFTKWSNVTRWYENAKQVTPGFAENWQSCLEVKKKYLG